MTEIKLGLGSKVSSSSVVGSSITISDFKTVNGSAFLTDFEESVLKVTFNVAEDSVAACVNGGDTSITIS